MSFFGKEHVNWSILSGVTRGWSGKIKSWKINYLFGYYVNFHGFSRKWIFQNLIFQVYPIITPLIMDQMTCSLPKNVTTFHGKEDGIINFCLRPHKRGVLALWIYILTKKIIDFPKLDFFSSSYHNFINIGPSDMFFTKKWHYFSWERRWNSSILSQTP